MAQYNGLNGMVYNLEKKIKSGGEGVTYSVQNNDHLIAKLYKDNVSPEESIRRVEKLRAMVGMGIDPMIDHHLGIAWPIDVLHEPSTGKAVGFVMPMAKGCESLIVAARPSERAGKLYGQEYTFRHSVATAYNLAQVVNVLHNHRMVVGDLNSKNILVNRFGEVTLIDTDSMQIMTDDGTLHKCSPFGMIESKAPELQGRDLRRPDVEFTVYSDRFALAVHIFELLCEGRHPFNLRNPD